MTLRRRTTSQQSASHDRGPARPTRLAAAALVAALIGTVLGASPAKAALEPVLVSTTPANGTAHTSASVSVITATYDRAVRDPDGDDPASSFVLRDNTNTLVDGDASRGPSNQQLNFDPSESLTESGSPYTATAVARPEVAGDPLTHSFTFAIDNTAPGAVTITAPAAGALVKDEPVSVMGTGEPGSTVKVFEGATQLGTGTASGAGTYNIAVALGNDNGVTTTLDVHQVDAAGNAGPSVSRSFIHDNVAPAAPAITAPAADLLTSSTEVTLSGTSENGTVQIRDNGVQIATTEATGGSWSKTVTGLADGGHPFTARTVDVAGNVSGTSATRTVTVDATAPAQPTVDYAPKPVNGQNQAAFLVGGTAETGSSIDIKISDESAGTADITGSTTTDEDGNYGDSFNLTPLDDGTITISVKSIDAASNQRTTSITFALDTTALPPVVTISPDEINSVSDNAITVSGTAEPGGFVTITVTSSGEGAGRNAIATVAANGTYAHQFDISVQGDGTITASATQQDKVANTSTAGSDTALKDATLPAAPVITVPAQDQVYVTTAVTVTGTSEANAVVEVKEDGVLKGTATANAGGNWTVPIVVSGDGYHTIKATQTDTFENVGTAEATRRFIVNTAVPTLQETDPANGALVNAVPTVTARYSEELSAGTLVVRNKNNTLVSGTKAVDGDTVTFTPSGGGLSDAGSPYSAQTTGKDLGGSDSVATIFTFSVDGTAPAAPSITSPTQGASLTTSNVTIAGSAEANSEVEVKEGATSLGTTTADGTGAWSLSHGFSNGSHSVTAAAEDAAGNVSPASAARTFSVDADAPDAPVINSPAAGALLNSGTVTIAGSAEPGSSISVRENGIQIATATTTGGGAWTTTAALADGEHTVTARATDGVGHVSVDSAARSFAVDTTAPLKPAITQPAGSPTVGNATVTISGTAEAGSAVRVYEGATLKAGPVTADASGLWSTSASFAEGGHSVTAKATDAAGNVSPASDPAAFTVDTTAPAVPVITQPAQNATFATYNVTVAGTAASGSVVTVREGSTIVGTATAGGTGDWSVPASYSNGPHSVTATAKDGVGNESAATAARAFTVNVDTTAPNAPLITTPSEGATLSSTSVLIAGTAEANSTVKVRENGVQIATAAANSGGSWSTAATFTPGSHTINATARDAAGNEGAASTNRTFTITQDTVAPAKPTITSPTAGSEHGQIVTVTGTAEPGASVRVREGTSTLATPIAGASGEWTTQLSFTDGSHTLNAVAVDAANNASVPSDSVTFTVDAARPSVGFTTGTNSVFLPVDEAKIEGTASDNKKVVSVHLVYRDITGVKVAEADATLDPAGGGTTVTWSHTPELLPGYYTVSAQATDANGLKSTARSIAFILLTV